MKSKTFCRCVIVIMAAALMNTSCIYEAPGDEFYRTLWESDEVPLEPFHVEEITLEFLCGNYISLKTYGSTITNYGTYSCNDQTAVFQDLTLELEGHTITFIDAQISGNTLFLHWLTEDSLDPFTMTMHRLSSYK